MPAGYDAEVAELFRDLRAASNLTETDLAARIATPIEVVQALEQGALYALPPWPETCRVVNAYGTLLNLDTRPLLRRIYAQLEAGIVELHPKAVPDVPVMAPQSSQDLNFGGGNNNAAAQPQRQPQAAPQWPNGPQRAPQQQPPWPGGAAQFPPGGMPQHAPQPAQGQAPWPNGPQGAGQPQVRQPQARPAQPRPAQPQPRPQQQQPQQRAPQPPQQPAPVFQQPGAALGQDAFMEEPPESAPKGKKPLLLKWGIGALVASVIGFGLWMALSDSDPSDSPGASGTSDPVLDPDDPRSRKADRLPSNF
ncbi:MAG: hypothetical protein ACRECX_11935 [Methyloceanibacter sp.]|uniref:helix-turn-helix domain-containing protein n=1 Tax=Methyloceanibacter sp. TaxID=1965321 RepID=UPI003D6CE5BD